MALAMLARNSGSANKAMTWCAVDAIPVSFSPSRKSGFSFRRTR
jgi:hypothetical protein